MSEAKVYWSGSVPKCDLDNSHELTNDLIYDAMIPSYRQWGLVCHNCFILHGASLGTGRGQKYQRQSEGRWLKVAG